MALWVGESAVHKRWTWVGPGQPVCIEALSTELEMRVVEAGIV